MKIKVYKLMYRNTVGPYRELKSFVDEKKAIAAMEAIAKENPEYEYVAGAKTFKVGKSSHHNTIYKIEESILEC